MGGVRALRARGRMVSARFLPRTKTLSPRRLRFAPCAACCVRAGRLSRPVHADPPGAPGLAQLRQRQYFGCFTLDIGNSTTECFARTARPGGRLAGRYAYLPGRLQEVVAGLDVGARRGGGTRPRPRPHRRWRGDGRRAVHGLRVQRVVLDAERAVQVRDGLGRRTAVAPEHLDAGARWSGVAWWQERRGVVTMVYFVECSPRDALVHHLDGRLR